MPFRTQIPSNLVGDEEIRLVDLMEEVRNRAEGIQYPISHLLTVENEARFFRAECLIIKPAGKVIIETGGRVIIKR